MCRRPDRPGWQPRRRAPLLRIVRCCVGSGAGSPTPLPSCTCATRSDCARGDRTACADLAPRLDPDDIVQSVFRTFFRRVARGQYDVPEGEDLWKLFMVIALHKIRSAAAFHRAAKRDVRRATATGLADAATGQDLVAPDEVALATLRMVIDELLGALPVSLRIIVELRVEGHEVERSPSGRSVRAVPWSEPCKSSGTGSQPSPWRGRLLRPPRHCLLTQKCSPGPRLETTTHSPIFTRFISGVFTPSACVWSAMSPKPKT